MRDLIDQLLHVIFTAGVTMRRLLLVSQWLPATKRDFIIRHQIHSYSLPYGAAEKIKNQLDFRDARLLIPDSAEPSSVYKGLVILDSGPVAEYPASKQFAVPYLESGLAVITMNRSLISFGFNAPAQLRMSRVFNVVSANLSEPCPVVMKLYCSGAHASFIAAAKELRHPDCKLKTSWYNI